MARSRNENLSGAPDISTAEATVDASPEIEATERPVIWDKDNRLVEPSLDEHYRAEAERVLGGGDTEAKHFVANAENIRASQSSISQTADPMTSPMPSSDPNTAPTRLTEIEPVTIAAGDPDPAKAEPVAVEGDDSGIVGQTSTLPAEGNASGEDAAPLDDLTDELRTALDENPHTP